MHAASIASASRTLITLNSTPNDGATDCIAPIVLCRRDRRIAEDGGPHDGAGNLFEQFQPFRHYAVLELGEAGDIAAWPGQAFTMPRPTGSIVCANTIGTLRLARTSGIIETPDVASTTSGASATSSAA